MLDSILVLGQIPGTHVQLSFWELLVLGLTIWLAIRVYRRPALRRKYVYWLRILVHYLQHPRTLRQRAH